MAKNFQYTLQAEGRGLKEESLLGSGIHSTWNIFHKNPDDKGLWTLTTEGYLQISSNQNGLSGRYDPSMLGATDYHFLTEAIPSGVDDDSFGLHFRYQDNFHFYFVAWDGGGEYNWDTRTLRLYKVNGDVYTLLDTREIGHWVGGQRYIFELSVTGNNIVVTLDGVEQFNYTDTDNPYLTGAYGPCATSQVTTWTRLEHVTNKSFLLSKNLDGVLTIDSFSYETGKKIHDSQLQSIFAEDLAAYIAANGYQSAGELDKYTISTAEPAVEVFFNLASPSKTTTDDYTYPYAYLKYDENPPSPPTNLYGTPTESTITWSWQDTSNFEDGYELLDENARVIAIVGKNVTTWMEQGLEQGTSYTRRVRAYNAYGSSASVTATVMTDKVEIISTPDAPKNLRGASDSTTGISWYWSPVDNADSYELYTEDGVLIAELAAGTTKYSETGLTPDTAYERYIVAKNLAGTSSRSNVALAFTDMEAPVNLDLPSAPVNMKGIPYGSSSIMWTWEHPPVSIDPNNIDGTPKTEEQIEEETNAALAGIAYRVYDANGEVLYEAPDGVYEFYEQNLTPDTGYTHYVKAYSKDGEGPRSNMAYAKTEPPFDDSIVDEEPEPEWPLDREYIPSDKEPDEKLKAFHSGIGDSLDLKVRTNKKGIPKELFTFDLQLKGYEYIPIMVYPKQDFKFRFKSEGIERMIVWTGDYIAKVRAYPKKSYQYKIQAEIDSLVAFSYKVKVYGRVKETIQSPIAYNYTPFANVAYSKTTGVTTASMFQDPATKAVYGPNTWEYDAVTDTVRGLQNVNWSGAYNNTQMNLMDYTFEAEIGVMNNNSSGDDDMIGIAFRINMASDGKMRMYYFVADRADSSGVGIGSKWKLGKTKDQAINSWGWPVSGVQVAASNIAGWVANQWYKIKVELTGPRIRIWVNDVLAIDVVDDDPDLIKGAFGPTNLSQIDFSAKNFTMETLSPEYITSVAANGSDLITDYNDQYNKKQVTTEPLSVLLNDAIQGAYENYKLTPGNENAILNILDYGVTDDNAGVHTETLSNGNGPVYAYTTNVTHTDVFHPVVIESNTFTDSISEIYKDVPTSKTLEQTINSVKKAYTASEIMQSYVDAYKTANGVSTANLFLDSYESVSLSTNETVTTSASGADVLHAYTSAGTIYKNEVQYQGDVYEYEGWVVNPDSASAIVLRNKYGATYTGSLNNVSYTLTDLLNDPEVLVAWSSTETKGTRTGADTHKVKTTAFIEQQISGVTDGKNPKYFYASDLITIPATPEYAECHLSLQKTGGHESTFLYFRTDETAKSYGTEVFSAENENVVVISADSRSIEKAWTGYSEWYDGSVNGRKPYEVDGDGKRDLYVPIEVPTPEGVEIDRWYVELNDETGNVEYIIENGVGNTTTKKNDYVTFSSNVMLSDTAEKIWYGPKISGETIYEVKENETLTVKDKFLSPYKDPVLSEKNIKKWKLIVTSKNPNVRIWVTKLYEPWAVEVLFLDVELKAKLINPTQTSWNPLIHNGFYYFNQREHFLYSDTKVKGKYTQTNGFQSVEFSYTVKAFCERIRGAGFERWTDTNRSHFKGIPSLVDLDSSIGDIVLAKDGNGVYVTEGIYTSEEKEFNGSVVEEWDVLKWVSSKPFDSEIIVEVSAFDGTVWTPWTAAVNNEIMPLPLTAKFKYRVTLRAGSEKTMSQFTHKDDLNSEFNLGAFMNTKSQSNMVLMNNTEFETGTWLSKVFDLGSNVENLGTITYVPVLNGLTGENIEIYTVTSDIPSGPWDGTGEPLVPLGTPVTNQDGTVTGNIVSVKKRYIRYQARFTRGKEDSVITMTLSSGTDFSKGKLDNIAIDAATFQLSDKGKDGTFISAPLDMGHITAFTALSLDATIPSGAAVDVFTLSADTIEEFTTLEETEANWIPLNVDGTIASLPKQYMKVRTVLKAGDSEATVKRVTHETKADFTGRVKSNVTITDTGMIQLVDRSLPGYYESDTLDFSILSTWGELSHISSLNGGNVKVSSQVSNSPLGPWSEWQPAGAANEIVSPPASFIRYRVDITPAEGEAIATYRDNTIEKFQLGAGIDNVTYTQDGTGITQTDPSKVMTFTSGTKEFSNIKSYMTFLKIATLSNEAVLNIYTKTSSDGNYWSSWEPLTTDGKIQSPSRKYLRYYIEVSVGYDAAALIEKVNNTREEFSVGILDNVEISETDALTITTMATGNFYSKAFDFGGRVIAWDSVELGALIPELEGGVRVFTASANNEADILYADLAAAQALTWVEATYDELTGFYTINSLPARYLAYRLEMTPGYGPVEVITRTDDTTQEWLVNTSAVNVTYDADFIALTDTTLEGSFTSEMIDWSLIADKWEGTTNFTLNVTGTESLDGSVELLIQTAPDSGTVFTAPETSLGVVQDGIFTAALTPGTVQQFMVYKLKLTPGTNLLAEPASPVVNSVEFANDTRSAKAPEVTSVTARTTETGGQVFKASEVRNIEINYKQKTYTGPVVDTVIVTGNIYNKLSPIVDSIYVNADVYYWKSPKLDSITLRSDIYQINYYTPTLHEVSYGAKLPAQVIEEEYGVSLMGSVLSDQEIHQVSGKTMKTIIDEYMSEYGVNQSNLVRKRYSLVSSVPGIFVETKGGNASIYYETGESEVFARTTDSAIETVYSQAKVIVGENNEALVTPVPQQGAPIVVKDASGRELRHVTFLDGNGMLTLTNTEEFEADGEREFPLTYYDIDLDTLEIWVDETFTNVYTKVEDYSVSNHIVTTKYTYAKGTPIRVTYKLLNSYYVDYNYNVEENYAMIKLHNPILTESGEITVRYETNLDTAYYDAEELNLNPMQSLMNEGFLYITDEVKPAKKLDVQFNPSTLHANGYDRTTIIVTARDELGNPVVGDIINFFVTDGDLIINQPVTDVNGMAVATYTTSKNAGDVELSVVDRTSVIEATKSIHVRSPKAKPRMTLEVNKSTIVPDDVDTVKITARVVGETQEPVVDTLVAFQTTEGTMLNATDNTNYVGEAYAYVKTNIQPSDDIMTIMVTVPDSGLVEYINLRVSEVAPIV